MSEISDAEIRAEIWFASGIGERVERGADWLDSVKPDWHLAIDLATLDISLGDSCICGQVFMEEVIQANMEYDAGKLENCYDDDYEKCYDDGYEYAVQNYLYDMDNLNNTDLIGTRYGFNYTQKLLDQLPFSDKISDSQRQMLSRWEWDLLAEEWIMQIDKRIHQKRGY